MATTSLFDDAIFTSALKHLSKRQRLIQFLLENIELLLSAAGLAIIALVPVVLSVNGENAWQVIALTAVLVGVLHGGIFWLVRRQQRFIRRRAIAQLRAMLDDTFRDQLSIIALNTHMAHVPEQQAQRIQSSIEAITYELDHLSEESLTHWKGRYENASIA